MMMTSIPTTHRKYMGDFRVGEANNTKYSCLYSKLVNTPIGATNSEDLCPPPGHGFTALNEIQCLVNNVSKRTHVMLNSRVQSI